MLIEWSVKREGGIDGKGMILEIEESKFATRNKYNVDRVVKGQWVFGGICRETCSSFVVPVEKRDKDTLLSIIRQNSEAFLCILAMNQGKIHDKNK